MSDVLVWFGILFCLSQCAMLSGLNLAFFSLTRLRLEIESEHSTSSGASVVLAMRRDSNFLLATILWGNVGMNVLLTLLSESIMTGLVAFVFSTVLITFFGEIIPQAYFSRHALPVASRLAPVLRIYRFVLYPIAKPCALMLDSWLGKEAVQFFSEENIKMFIRKHIESKNNEIDRVEGVGAINFLIFDDQNITEEGEVVDPKSIVELPTKNGMVRFPEYRAQIDDPFVQRINRTEKKWTIIVNEKQEPIQMVDIDAFIRSEILHDKGLGIQAFCHTPLVIKDVNANLGSVVAMLRNSEFPKSDLPIATDVVLYWSENEKRIITGADLLGRLLKDI